ncbi:UvrABC system protein C [Desulfonema limicola]|uniref:UvrABC system protein C n=1 Tax=Desulfonema limicola TaxID=45656 RepID=A0A975B973_9BACT|nr:excinuclease ABC subunit UvrC [Desulfonema limicola]QTA81241.1 UvrABC system protein C [Desulfonema limicola]
MKKNISSGFRIGYTPENISQVSSNPGVYLMKDNKGNIIYVGKAKNLRKRISSYFQKSEHPDLKTGLLVKKIAFFETIITESENNALMLESNLIKHFKPRYNIILKDGRQYPSLCLNIKEPYPSLTVVRKTKKDGALYFGPYTSPGAAYQTLKIINKNFKLRKCKTSVFKTRTRPCLNWQIGACLGPCCLDVDKDLYNEIVKEIILFLKGRTPDLIQKIRKEMQESSEKQNYELAAELRDKISALKKTIEKQVIVTTDFIDRDIAAIARSHERIMVNLLSVRGGFLINSQNFPFTQTLADDSEIIETFIHQYYEKTNFIPKEILTSIPLENTQITLDYLEKIKHEKISILTPQRGEKMSLVNMAVKNAKQGLKDFILSETDESFLTRLLTRLQTCLKAKQFPRRIECFDNSNISGTSPVAGMVVFENGKPLKSGYRKYKIKTVQEPDDYAYMAEILKRRYGRGEDFMPFPDLLMVDGGKGQLNTAVSVIRELGIEGRFDIIGIAKKDEKTGETRDKIYKPGRSNPVNMGKDNSLIFFLQQIRDETHRFAISFHRSQRGKKSLGSILDSIPGVGLKRKKDLLNHFGSIKKIQAATLEQIKAVPGISAKTAEAVLKKFHQ